MAYIVTMAVAITVAIVIVAIVIVIVVVVVVVVGDVIILGYLAHICLHLSALLVEANHIFESRHHYNVFCCICADLHIGMRIRANKLGLKIL